MVSSELWEQDIYEPCGLFNTKIGRQLCGMVRKWRLTGTYISASEAA